MSDKKLLVVIGATGQQGGSVARVFKSLEPAWKVRGITRNPASTAATSLAATGVDVVQGDLDVPATLDEAFDGADAIFSVTDFWQFLAPRSATFAEAERKGVAPNRLAMEKEVQQGKNIIQAAAKAHARKPLIRFVLSNLSDTLKWSNGTLKNNLHFDGKAEYTTYLRKEHPSLASVTSYLQVGAYLSNATTNPAFAPRIAVAAQGNKEVIVPYWIPLGGKPTPFVDPPNDTGHFVRALVLSDRAPPGTTIVGYSRSLPVEKYAQLWGQGQGLPGRIQHMAYDDFLAAGLPTWLAAELSNSGEYGSKFGWDGGEKGVKSPEEVGVDIAALTNVEEWILSKSRELKPLKPNSTGSL